MYQIGCAKALQDSGAIPVDAYAMAEQKIKVAGTSAGSVMAATLAMGVDFSEAFQYAIECREFAVSKIRNAFKLRDIIEVGVQRFAVGRMQKDPNLSEAINKTLECYATVLPTMTMKRFENCYETPEDIGEAIKASCCLTPIAGLPFQLRKTGEWVIDGAPVAFQPRAGEPDVITISALYYSKGVDIKPSRYTPAYWGLYPPSEEDYLGLYHLGFEDTLRVLQKKGLGDGQKIAYHLAECEKRNQEKKEAQRALDSKNTSSASRAIRLFLADIPLMFLFLVVLRPIAFVAIFLEMMICTCWAYLPVSSSASGASLYLKCLLDIGTWKHLLAFSSSLLPPLHSSGTVGAVAAAPAASLKLEDCSLIYRVLRPILYIRH